MHESVAAGVALNLDLGTSDAKLTRARQHLVELERQVPADLIKSDMYSVRLSEVDPETGWASILMGANDTSKPHLGVLVGDVVHNLRCALDYIITALVDASQAKLTRSHQFPIFADSAQYAGDVGTVAVARGRGPLAGVRHGLGLIEQLQPYHLKPNPRRDPLWHVHRLSNADKHREPSALVTIPKGSIDIRFKGTVVEKRPVATIAGWTPDQEHAICHLRFDPPVARDFKVVGPLTVDVWFTTPAFGREEEFATNLRILRKSCDHVAMVIDLFKQL